MDELEAAAKVIGLVVAVLGGIAVLWSKYIGPFLARPIGRTIGAAIRSELQELVEETITGMNANLLARVGDLARRVALLERELNDLESRVSTHQRKPHVFVGGPGGG